LRQTSDDHLTAEVGTSRTQPALASDNASKPKVLIFCYEMTAAAWISASARSILVLIIYGTSMRSCDIPFTRFIASNAAASRCTTVPITSAHTQ